jgi:endopolyphosphatase
MRERGMKAILIGHVPPARTDSKLSWDETCWQKFTLWQRQYRDVILGSLFGHMNIDHFILHDFKDLTKDAKKGRMASVNALDDPENRVTMMEDGELTVASASSYLSDLGDIWAELPAPLSSGQLSAPSDDSGDCSQYSPLQRVMSLLRNPRKGRKDKKGDRKKGFLHKIGGRYAERYSVTHVPPSVVPTYFPTLRVYTYNISGLEDIVVPARPMLPPRLTASHLPSFDDTDYQKEVRNAVRKHKKRKQKHAVKRKKYKFKVPSPPTKSAPPGPAYSPQSLTFLGYVQYFANLTKINNHDGKHERHQGSTRPTNPFEYEVEYNTTDDGQYKLEDLTVRSYLDLAHRIGCDKVECRKVRESDSSEQDDEYHVDHLAEDIELKRSNKGKHKKHKKLDPSGAWYTFIDRAFVRTKSTRDLEREFTAQDTPQLDGTSQEVMEL